MKKILFLIIGAIIFGAAFAFPAAPVFSAEPGGVVLALSGGGTRGVAHVGILKLLEDEKIPIAGIVGTSMGSIIGGIASCGYSADQITSIILNLDFTSLFYNRNVPSESPLGKESNTEAWAFYRMLLDEEGDRVGPLGALRGIRLYEELEKIVKPCSGIHDFNDLPIPFAAVATDLGRGEAVVIRRGSLADAMRASMSIPGLFEPWRLDGRLMVDGGLVANLPVRIAKRLFPGYPVIAVDISGASRTEEEINTTVDVLDQAVNIMTSRELRRDIEVADLLIRPDLGQMQMLQTKKLGAVVQAGFTEARKRVSDIRELAANAPAMAVQNRMRGIESQPLIKECACDIADVPEDERLKAAKKYKYELLLGGKYSTFNDHNWLYADMITRDFREKDDTITYSLIAGEEWGLGLKYLDSGQKWKQRSETSLFIRRRKIEPRNAPDTEWYRFATSYTERFFLGSLRAGLGLTAEYYDGDVGSDHHLSPTLFIIHNSLDDEVDPTTGGYARADIWWPDADEIVARLDMRQIHSFSEKTRLMLRGGAYIGNDEHPYYTAYIGGREELYSLSENPLSGENMAWWRATLRNVVVKDWWGTLNVDLFYSRGYLMDSLFDTVEEPWEAGLALSLPGSLFNGKIIVVYSDDDDWNFGLTLGIPAWEEGAVP